MWGVEQVKARWRAKVEAAWMAEYEPKFHELRAKLEASRLALEAQNQALADRQAHLTRQEETVTLLEERVRDRQQELARVNDELRQQIRMVEAKASPDNVWVTSFAAGFEKAWDCMWPLLFAGVQKSQEALYQLAVDKTLQGLDGTIQQRAESLGATEIREKQALLTKQVEFTQKRAAATDPAVQAKYDHYLEAIGWALHANSVPRPTPSA